MWYILGVLAVLAVLVLWVIKSCCNVVQPDEVALKSYFGHLRHRRFSSGLAFVPFFPGIKLIRITKKLVAFRYKGVADHSVWSSDHQLLIVDVSGNVRYPYDEIESLIQMVESGVPTGESGLQGWAEDEIISGLRDIMAGYPLEQAISRSNLTAINNAAKEFFLRPDGLFAKSGICGNDLTSFTLGTGEVILRVEQVNPTAGIQKAMEAPVVARYEALAAPAIAERDASLIGGPINRLMEQWVTKMVAETGKTQKEITESPSYQQQLRVYKDLILADGGNLGVDRIEVGAPDGTSISGELGSLTAVAALFGGRGSGRGNRGGGGKKSQKTKDEEGIEDALQ